MSIFKRIKAVTIPLLRIPMRGYETRIYVFVSQVYGRYESPCGVMRLHKDRPIGIGKRLRIPMRGYERDPEPEKIGFGFVTNPHAGL